MSELAPLAPAWRWSGCLLLQLPLATFLTLVYLYGTSLFWATHRFTRELMGIAFTQARLPYAIRLCVHASVRARARDPCVRACERACVHVYIARDVHVLACHVWACVHGPC